MSVGAFPGINARRRRTVRAPINPMDKSTIFSIYPARIDEVHHTIQPGRFVIEKGSPEKPTCLVVGPSSWWREIDEEQPLLEIPNGSNQVADAVVKGYCSGLLACDMSERMPGIFWAPGSHSVAELKTDANLAKLFKKALEKQNRYWEALIRLADGLWARTNGNPLTISDQMRMAAEQLNVVGKDWMQNFTMLQNIRCPACGSPHNPNFPVCATCKAVVDVKLAKERGIIFAQDGAAPTQSQVNK